MTILCPESNPQSKNRLTHGTMETRILAESRRFYRDFLGLRCNQHHVASQVVAGAGDFVIAAVGVRNRATSQGPENHWILRVDSADAVIRARIAAMAHRDEVGVKKITDLEGEAGHCSFMLQDPDGNWWEIVWRDPNHYQKLFGDRS